jgi:peptidoglycan/LPS O-acetylase OafA/YrhL
VEEHFYLLFPWIAFWMMCWPLLGRTVAMGLAVVAFGMGVRGYVWLHEMARVRDQDGSAFGLCFVEGIYYPTWARLDGLLAGVALAARRIGRPQLRTRWQTRRAHVLMAATALCALAVWLFRHRQGFWPILLGYPLLSLSLALWVMLAADLSARWKLPARAGWHGFPTASTSATSWRCTRWQRGRWGRGNGTGWRHSCCTPLAC